MLGRLRWPEQGDPGGGRQTQEASLSQRGGTIWSQLEKQQRVTHSIPPAPPCGGKEGKRKKGKLNCRWSGRCCLLNCQRPGSSPRLEPAQPSASELRAAPHRVLGAAEAAIQDPGRRGGAVLCRSWHLSPGSTLNASPLAPKSTNSQAPNKIPHGHQAQRDRLCPDLLKPLG